MRILVNGEPTDVPSGSTISDAAAAIGIEPEARGVAVALDGEVVPRKALGTLELTEGQRVEIVAAIQGGAW